MITESEIQKLIDKIVGVNSYRKLDILQKDILYKISYASTFDPQLKFQLKRKANVALTRKELLLFNQLNSEVDRFTSVLKNNLSSIKLGNLATANVELDMIENKVSGAVTKFTSWEKLLTGVSSSTARKLLIMVRKNKNELELLIKGKKSEIERERSKRKAERERIVAVRRVERRKRREEEQKKKKQKSGSAIRNLLEDLMDEIF